MPPYQTRGQARSLTGVCRVGVACKTRRNHDEGDDGNYQEPVMGGEANALGGNIWIVGYTPPTVISGVEFMRVFTAIEQVVRNTMQEMLVPARAAGTKAAIRECLNETKRITNSKPQREGTSIWPEGHFLKKPKSFILSDQISRGGPTCFGCHQPGHRVVDCPLKGWSYHETVLIEEEQSRASLRNDISSRTVGNSGIAGATDGYLYCVGTLPNV
ncbi:hypothetical protein Acr_07g0013610 [Actinidia rufa]|uniref:CCHC-type domain-containing protein n=1 Tax=Actinidia rufa TaxID=165716 RepID=A0A7J0EXJ2_9ERIC|nr:hypothetical protein Acr_07g0013610 [Actinidia rufa]